MTKENFLYLKESGISVCLTCGGLVCGPARVVQRLQLVRHLAVEVDLLHQEHLHQSQISIQTHGPTTTQSSVLRHLDQSELSIETAQQSIKTSDQPEHRSETSDQSEQSIDTTDFTF